MNDEDEASQTAQKYTLNARHFAGRRMNSLRADAEGTKSERLKKSKGVCVSIILGLDAENTYRASARLWTCQSGQPPIVTTSLIFLTSHVLA